MCERTSLKTRLFNTNLVVGVASNGAVDLEAEVQEGDESSGTRREE